SRERRVSSFVSGVNREEFINANPRADAPKRVRAVRRLMPLSADRERILPPLREVANEYIYPFSLERQKLGCPGLQLWILSENHQQLLLLQRSGLIGAEAKGQW